jgi:uracil-DNA glycosylase
METASISISQHLTDPEWNKVLTSEIRSPYFEKLSNFLEERIRQNQLVYPPQNLIFNALNLTPFKNVKVVLLGQDPYHGNNQAHGLCFSVQNGVPLPPSLKNIFKELKADLALPIPTSGNLETWAGQGVLMLNATLTVENGKPGSHQGMGWEIFTDQIIRLLSEKKSDLIFLLWGKFAQAKSVLIDESKHTVLKAAHPSPFSAYNGFFGCRHFSKTNSLLVNKGIEPVNWNLNQ